MQADGTSLDVDMKSEKLIAVKRTTCPTKTTTLNLKKKVILQNAETVHGTIYKDSSLQNKWLNSNEEFVVFLNKKNVK